MAQPIMPDNALTRMIDRAHQRNMGETRREAPVNAGASPAARSAAIDREVQPPLTMQEREELDAKARELGLLPVDESAQGPYATLADAMQAGSAVPDAPSAVVDFKSAGRAAERVVAGVRLPDFTRVGGIDLIRNVIYVDSMEFAISKADADEFRLYCIQIAHYFVTQKLNEAVAALGAAVMEATGGEAVQPVQEDKADGEVLPGEKE